jgi:hypothetical protein
MSGESHDSVCPCCGKNMNCYSDWKPFDLVSGDCLNCGFTYFTKTDRMTLKEVNQCRKDMDLKPIKKLAKQKQDWRTI